MRRKIALIFSILLVTILTSVYNSNCASEEESTELKLYLGEVKILPVNNPTRIAIGNPAVIDVTNVTKSEMTISPKAVGNSTLVFWDNFGEQPYKAKVFAENMQQIKERVDNLLTKLGLTDVRTQAEDEENKVLLLGSVKRPQDREKIALALGPLKDKTVDLTEIKEEETVVEIDVKLLELSKDATDTLGFTNPLSSTISISEVAAPAGTYWTKLFKVGDLSRGVFTWTIDALVKEGKAKILSRPRLACQSGKEAELLVGGEKPIFTTDVASAGGQGTSIEYKEYGIKLKIKPTVTEDKRIKVSLKIETSEIGTAESIGTTSSGVGTSSSTTTARAYPLTRRNVTTELYLDDGQTLAIGGLIKQKLEEDVIKTPWLGDLPLVGGLFRKKTTKTGGGTGERGNTELYVTITPTVVAEKIAAAAPKNNQLTPSENKEITPSETPIVPAQANLAPDLKNYISIIQKRIVDNVIYPPAAKEAGFAGTIKLKLHLSYLGELLDVSVKESSGYKILDEDAVNTARKLISFPPFPTSIEEKDLWVDIPIVYQL